MQTTLDVVNSVVCTQTLFHAVICAQVRTRYALVFVAAAERRESTEKMCSPRVSTFQEPSAAVLAGDWSPCGAWSLRPSTLNDFF